MGDKMLVVYGYRMHTARALLVVLYRFIIGRINNLGSNASHQICSIVSF